MSSSGMAFGIPFCVCKITKQSQTYELLVEDRLPTVSQGLRGRRDLPWRRLPERPNLARAWVAYGTAPFALYVLL